jgi:hypothetical protein
MLNLAGGLTERYLTSPIFPLQKFEIFYILKVYLQPTYSIPYEKWLSVKNKLSKRTNFQIW